MAENVKDISAWAGMFKDFFRQIQDESITREQLDAFLGHRNPFAAKYITIIDDGKKKTSEIIAELRKITLVWVYKENEVDKEFPTPAKSTSRKFLLAQEADEDLKNRSADDLEQENIPGINLRERLLYELEYYRRIGQYLDIKNVTLCSGSRYSGGQVPSVFRNSGRMDVNWDDPDNRCDYLRARRAVT